jgi:hypothetical protein
VDGVQESSVARTCGDNFWLTSIVIGGSRHPVGPRRLSAAFTDDIEEPSALETDTYGRL